MAVTVVLLHSPSVGPRTWQPVADELRRRGRAVVVPDLLGVATGSPPFWPAVRDAVTSAVADVDTDLLLVPHSNAGLYVPVVTEALGGRVTGTVFVDAALPALEDSTPVAAADQLVFLRGLATDGLLPRWTDSFDARDVTRLFPDTETMTAVVAEQPRLPLSYYEQVIPAPAGWSKLPNAYLWFGVPYGEIAEEAGRRGWPVRRLPGEHLHTVVDPVGVADAVLALGMPE
jgi:hypothetical protein